MSLGSVDPPKGLLDFQARLVSLDPFLVRVQALEAAQALSALMQHLLALAERESPVVQGQVAPLQNLDARLWNFRGHLQDQHLAAAVEVRALAKLGLDFLNLHLQAVAADQVPVWLPLAAPESHPAVPVVSVGPVVMEC